MSKEPTHSYLLKIYTIGMSILLIRLERQVTGLDRKKSSNRTLYYTIGNSQEILKE